MKFSALLLSTMMLAAAGGTIAAETPKHGGLLKFAVSAEPPNYDCHAQTSFAFIHPVRPHYNTPLKFDTAHYPKVTGDLARRGRCRRTVCLYLQAQESRRFTTAAFSSEDIKRL